MILPPSHCVDEVVCLAESRYASHRLVAFWRVCPGSRTNYAEQVATARGSRAVLPIVLRRADLFASANAVSSDLREILQEKRSEVEALLKASDTAQLILLLLSAESIRVPQVASLLELPDWFPFACNETIDVPLVDLMLTADGPIDAEETRRFRVATALFQLDRTIVVRLLEQAATNRRAAQDLAQLLPSTQGQLKTYVGILENAGRCLDGLPNPERFRPSARDSNCFSSLAMKAVTAMSSQELEKVGLRLVEALGLDDVESAQFPAEPLFALLTRSANRPASPAAVFGRVLVMLCHAAAQLLTACAHADQYPRYPLQVMDAQSRDLVATIECACALINESAAQQ